jgi:hypothetical protein
LVVNGSALAWSNTVPKAEALKVNNAIGSSTEPVYFNGSGKPVACGYDFTNYITTSTFNMRLDTINTKLTNFYDKSEMDDLLDALEERISSLETDLAALAEDFDGHSHGYVTNYELNQAINGVQNSIDALSDRIDNIKECTCTPNPTN